MKFLSIVLISLVSFAIPPAVYSCSCPYPPTITSRHGEIFDFFCRLSQRIYVGTVIGATCNCINSAGGERTSTYCQDYQLHDTTTVVSAEVVARGECSNVVPFLGEYLRNCTVLGTIGSSGYSGGVIPSGFTVDGPSDSNLPEVTNTTKPFGIPRCSLSCPFNINVPVGGDVYYYETQPCFYRVRIEEVFKGNITEGDILTVGGPDVLTTCGSIGRLLQINQSYVIGIGGPCSLFSEWSASDIWYTMQEFEQLRDLRRRYTAGTLDCSADPINTTTTTPDTTTTTPDTTSTTPDTTSTTPDTTSTTPDTTTVDGGGSRLFASGSVILSIIALLFNIAYM